MAERVIEGEFILIDDEDEHVLDEYTWHVVKEPGGERYARAWIHGDWVYLHRLVMSEPLDLLVDHIKGCGLDCRKSNLRIATHVENSRNRRKHRGKSRFKGVSPHRDKWRATIHSDGKQINLGIYVEEESAARAYDQKAMELFGQFARLNFPEGTEESVNVAYEDII